MLLLIKKDSKEGNQLFLLNRQLANFPQKLN
jgi:hypothetical protein